jgi:hypothetical protein
VLGVFGGVWNLNKICKKKLRDIDN